MFQVQPEMNKPTAQVYKNSEFRKTKVTFSHHVAERIPRNSESKKKSPKALSLSWRASAMAPA